MTKPRPHLQDARAAHRKTETRESAAWTSRGLAFARALRPGTSRAPATAGSLRLVLNGPACVTVKMFAFGARWIPTGLPSSPRGRIGDR
jgi:hypothetical protein